MNYEQEEEFLTNDLTRKLAQVLTTSPPTHTHTFTYRHRARPFLGRVNGCMLDSLLPPLTPYRDFDAFYETQNLNRDS